MSMNEPNNYRQIRVLDEYVGQRIELGWYETDEGVDEKCVLVYLWDKLTQVEVV